MLRAEGRNGKEGEEGEKEAIMNKSATKKEYCVIFPALGKK